MFSAHVKLQAQNNNIKDNFSYEVKTAEGDLNHDKIKDRVVVDMDIKDGTRPLRMQILLLQPNSKKLKLVVSTTKIIESQYPKEKRGKHSEGNIPDFFIEKGILQMVTDIKNCKSRYFFKYRNGNLELNSVERVIWDGKETTIQTAINLLTGSKVVYDQDLGPDKKYKIRQKNKPKPLPKIQDLTFSELEAF